MLAVMDQNGRICSIGRHSRLEFEAKLKYTSPDVTVIALHSSSLEKETEESLRVQSQLHNVFQFSHGYIV